MDTITMSPSIQGISIENLSAKQVNLFKSKRVSNYVYPKSHSQQERELNIACEKFLNGHCPKGSKGMLLKRTLDNNIGRERWSIEKLGLTYYISIIIPKVITMDYYGSSSDYGTAYILIPAKLSNTNIVFENPKTTENQHPHVRKYSSFGSYNICFGELGYVSINDTLTTMYSNYESLIHFIFVLESLLSYESTTTYPYFSLSTIDILKDEHCNLKFMYSTQLEYFVKLNKIDIGINNNGEYYIKNPNEILLQSLYYNYASDESFTQLAKKSTRPVTSLSASRLSSTPFKFKDKSIQQTLTERFVTCKKTIEFLELFLNYHLPPFNHFL